MPFSKITIKTKEEIEIMREGGKILAEIMENLKSMTKPGVKTIEIDNLAMELVLKYKVEPAFKDYEGYPKASCISVNNVIVHSVPNEYVLKEGDVVCIDMGVRYKGYYTDMAITVGMGELDPENGRMIKAAKKALRLGVAKSKVGNTFGDIGNTVERFVEYQGFGVVKELCGHGIGKSLHEDPKIPNNGKRHSGPKIEEGMVFCIEPMITRGDWRLKKSSDGFGYETVDGSYSAHFEHTIAIVNGAPEVLTKH